jgi:uncharacterized protein
MTHTNTICILRHTSPRAFRARAEAWLLEREAENNLILGLAAQLEESITGYKPPIYLATIERNKEILGCAFRTPPFNLGITRLPAEAVMPLAADVAEIYDSLSGVLGPDSEAAALAAAWVSLRRVVVREAMRERIYRLERVIDPEDPAVGYVRPATESDLGIVTKWGNAFSAEAGVPANEERMQELIARERILLWEDGGPRSMAASSGDTPNGSRVGYVYTPSEWRRRGYASACVAALSRQIIEGGRRFCFLYTDLSNPTSNSIYQRIGYEPVCDVVDYRFDQPAGEALLFNA